VTDDKQSSIRRTLRRYALLQAKHEGSTVRFSVDGKSYIGVVTVVMHDEFTISDVGIEHTFEQYGVEDLTIERKIP